MRRASPVLSTYRLQFRREFPFAAGAALAGYLRRLGVSHVYASPILAARAGSPHGYDVISYARINPELGGIDGFRAMAQAFRREDIGIILDIVPNHVAVGGDDNAMWLDLLKKGRASAYADWFDVDFDSADPVLAGRIHAPFLGEPLGAVLAGGKLALVEDPERAGFALRYGAHLFPIRAEDDAGIRAAPDSCRGADALAALIARQHYLLDHWRTASDRLNWRRFFDITELAGMRMEHPEAFEAAHRLAFRLYEEGWIDGLRIDHVDGLADPAGYCAALRARLDALAPRRPGWAAPGRAWLVVEKILAPGETLPAAWGIDGTTGYDVMDEVSALLHAADPGDRLGRLWSELGRRPAGFAEEEESARGELLDHAFAGQLEAVVDRLALLAQALGRDRDIPRGALRRATAALACHLRCYRTYLTGRTAPEDPGPFFAQARAAARARPLAEPLALDFVGEVMAGTAEGVAPARRQEVVRRFNQLTSPLAARSVEDTAFYRHGRLLSRNEVGSDAGRHALPVADFHRAMAERGRRWPAAMLALSTHDHKRGADVRARLATVSHDVDAWEAAVRDWFARNAAIRPDGLDRGDEYQLYQMLVGTWPLGGADAGHGARLWGWWRKALREAKLRTGWAAPDESYEGKAAAFLAAALDHGRSAAFREALGAYVDRIAPAAALNGLAQLVLQCTVPGVPDTYQGCEFWDFSMVDPDNRRAVDFPARAAALEHPAGEDGLRAAWRDGRIKQHVLHRLLTARRDHPHLFRAGYRPLAVGGARSGRLAAFVRETEDLALAVIVPLACPASVGTDLSLRRDWWDDTRVALPAIAGPWIPLVGLAPPVEAPVADGGLGCRVMVGRR